LTITEQTLSTGLEKSGELHSLIVSESTAHACSRELCARVHRAVQNIVKISGQEGLYCMGEAECGSYSGAAGPGAWGDISTKTEM